MGGHEYKRFTNDIKIRMTIFIKVKLKNQIIRRTLTNIEYLQILENFIFHENKSSDNHYSKIHDDKSITKFKNVATHTSFYNCNKLLLKNIIYKNML